MRGEVMTDDDIEDEKNNLMAVAFYGPILAITVAAALAALVAVVFAPKDLKPLLPQHGECHHG